MTKLPKKTLDDIYFTEVKALFKENKAFPGFKEYFREQVQSCLERDKIDKFHIGYFDNMKLGLEIITEYQEKINNRFPENFFSRKLVGQLLFGQNIIANNKGNLWDILTKSKDKNLEYVVKLCKPIEEFKNLCNNANVRYVLASAKEQNLEYTIELLNIKTIREFEEFSNNDYIKRILEESNLETLKVIIDFLDITKDNFNIFSIFTNILELSINIDSETLAYLLDLYEIGKGINKVSSFNNFAGSYSHFVRNIKKGVLDNIKTFNRDIQKHIIKIAGADGLNKLENSFDFIKEHKYGVLFGFFIEFARNGVHFLDIFDFPINKTNFLDFMQDDDTLFEFEETGTQFIGTKPWTKAWFKEKPERIKFVNSHDLYDYNTLGLIPGKLNKAISNFSIKNLDLWENLSEFVNKKIIPSKHNTKLFTENKIPASDNFNKLFAYYLENKQNSIIPMMEKLSFIEEFGLDINLENFKTLDDFRDENGELKIIELKRNFEKLLRLNGENKSEKYLKQFDNFVSRKNIKGLEKLLAENFITYFDYFYHKKIKIKVISSIKANIGERDVDFDSIDNSKLDREEFIEAYKMSLDPSDNKRQINRLLLDYLTGKFDNLEELNQYKTTGNINWLDKNLSKSQQEVWLSKNRKEIISSDEIKNIESESSNENTESRINHHIETAIKKIEELNKLGFDFKTSFENKGEFKKYFNLEIKKKEEEIKTQIGESNIYEDLKFQINEILKLEKNNSDFKSKKSSKIIIERELDPIKSLMMGNWVDGSCLSFYSSVGNYYSAISNTIDVNKGVYYIRNEDGNLLGRCLITIGEDKKISRYKMYYSGRVDIPIDKYFDEYTRGLANEIGLKLNGDEDLVKNIECDKWYQDGTQKI